MLWKSKAWCIQIVFKDNELGFCRKKKFIIKKINGRKLLIHYVFRPLIDIFIFSVTFLFNFTSDCFV